MPQGRTPALLPLCMGARMQFASEGEEGAVVSTVTLALDARIRALTENTGTRPRWLPVTFDELAWLYRELQGLTRFSDLDEAGRHVTTYAGVELRPVLR